MTGREAATLAAPGVAVGLVAIPFGFAYGPVHWWAAAVGVGLSVPPAFVTYWLTKRLIARHPLGGLMGMMIGVIVRLVVAVGGGAAVFFGTGAFEAGKLGFWFWLLVTYLGALVAETVLLAGPLSKAAKTSGGEG